MKTKEEILAKRIVRFPEPERLMAGGMTDESIKRNVYSAMDEHAKQFAEWLAENTLIVYEDKITLYRYHDQNNEWGNYTLEDIYKEYTRP